MSRLQDLVRQYSDRIRGVQADVPETVGLPLLNPRWFRRFIRIKIKEHFLDNRLERQGWKWYAGLHNLVGANNIVALLGFVRRSGLASRVATYSLFARRRWMARPLVFPETALELQLIGDVLKSHGLTSYGLPELALQDFHVGPSLSRMAFGKRPTAQWFGGVEQEGAISAIGMMGAYLVAVKEPKTTVYDIRILCFDPSEEENGIIEITSEGGNSYLRRGVSLYSSDYSLAILSDMLSRNDAIRIAERFFAENVNRDDLFYENERRKNTYEQLKDAKSILQHQKLRVYSHRIGKDFSVEGYWLYKDMVGRFHGTHLKDNLVTNSDLNLLGQFDPKTQLTPTNLTRSIQTLQSYTASGNELF
jgi:hypothetical protein